MNSLENPYRSKQLVFSRDEMPGPLLRPYKNCLNSWEILTDPVPQEYWFNDALWRMPIYRYLGLFESSDQAYRPPHPLSQSDVNRMQPSSGGITKPPRRSLSMKNKATGDSAAIPVGLEPSDSELVTITPFVDSEPKLTFSAPNSSGTVASRAPGELMICRPPTTPCWVKFPGGIAGDSVTLPRTRSLSGVSTSTHLKEVLRQGKGIPEAKKVLLATQSARGIWRGSGTDGSFTVGDLIKKYPDDLCKRVCAVYEEIKGIRNTSERGRRLRPLIAKHMLGCDITGNVECRVKKNVEYMVGCMVDSVMRYASGEGIIREYGGGYRKSKS